MSPDQKSQFELPMKEIVKVPVDTLNKVINKKESELVRLVEEARLAEAARLATIEAARLAEEARLAEVVRLAEESVVSGLSVNSIKICESINDSLRKPFNSGKVFPVTLGQVYCFTNIKNTLNERTILYEWYYQGNSIHKHPVKIQRSNYYRSWASKKIKIGEWYVLVRDKETNIVLETAYFSISNE